MSDSKIPSVSDPRIIVALDFDDEEKALALVDQLNPQHARLKVGKEMFTRFGPQYVERLQNRGFEIFLDLKFHDIPNTVAKAVSAAASLGVWMVNVHASGGQRMMAAAVEALANFQSPPRLIAVTVLTSMDDSDLKGLGITLSPAEQALKLAGLAAAADLDGVVCSAQEAAAIKAQCGSDFLCVTPGIRPQGSEVGDQRRIMTPSRALESGSDYLVIGRPITGASDPAQAVNDIIKTIQHSGHVLS